MDLRQLRALLGVADHGGFSAAADALHTVQSNVSAHLKRLEKELGATLVDRHTGQLTEEGSLVAARARRIEAELDALVADVAALRHEVIGTARLGMISTTARWLVPELLELAQERHPRLRLELVEGTSVSLETPLGNGQIDLLVGTPTSSGSDLEFRSLFEEDLVLVVPAGDPLDVDHPITLVELATRPLLLPLPGTAFRTTIDSAAAAAGVHLSPRAEVDGTRLIASLTFDGYGPSILPATAVPNYLRDDWKLVAVDGLPRRTVGVFRRRRRATAAPSRAVVDLLVELTSDDTFLPAGLHPATGDRWVTPDPHSAR